MRVLVLSGGAFRGAVQLPVIKHLTQQHQYDYVYGVSVGAINAAMVAQNKLAELQTMWESINSIGGFLKLKWYWPFEGAYNMAPLRRKIENLVSLRNIETPLGIGVISLTDNKYYHLNTSTMFSNKQLWDAIHASSAIRGLMVTPTLQINGTRHRGADGGFRNNLPVPPSMGFTDIDVVACVPFDDKVPALGPDIINGRIRAVDIAALKYMHPNARITLYNPAVDLGPSFLANKKTIKWRMHQGDLMIKNPITI